MKNQHSLFEKPLLFTWLRSWIFILGVLSISGCAQLGTLPKKEQLLRASYASVIAGEERDYFVFLPQGYDEKTKEPWPVIMFLHGDGERGDGKADLDYVLKYGPIYEAWVQKKTMPFIVVAPQLHMFDRDTLGFDYIDNRKRSDIPQRVEETIPKRVDEFDPSGPLATKVPIEDMSCIALTLPNGWDYVRNDLLKILDDVQAKYNADTQRVYLTGASYGGFGVWDLASTNPHRFAAIAPVVGWGHPELMSPIAERKLPVWVFAGGRDKAVRPEYFYAGLNKLEELGHEEVRFTIHSDMSHDVWQRVYSGDDLYTWLLQHRLPSIESGVFAVSEELEQ